MLFCEPLAITVICYPCGTAQSASSPVARLPIPQEAMRIPKFVKHTKVSLAVATWIARAPPRNNRAGVGFDSKRESSATPTLRRRGYDDNTNEEERDADCISDASRGCGADVRPFQ